MEGIAYQNKDVTSKVLAEGLKNKSLEVYGVHLPQIVDVMPTNLPVIEANELRLDNLFRFSDGSYGIVDYESEFDETDKITYLNYLARVAKRLLKDNKNIKLHMIVLYTTNVECVNTELDMGCLKLRIHAGYLSGIDAPEVLKNIANKVRRHETLSDEELMQIIVLPLAGKNIKERQKYLKEVIDTAKTLESKEQQVFALAGILVFSDKIIEKEYAEKIRRWIQMTQVGRIIEREKEEAVREAVEKVERKAERQKMAFKMLLKGEKPEDVVEKTGLTKEEVEELTK